MREPRAGNAPVSLDRRRREVKRSRSLVDVESSEETTLDDCSSPWIDLAQLVERFVKLDQLGSFQWGGLQSLVESDRNLPASALSRLCAPRCVDQHLPHRTRDQQLEMCGVICGNRRWNELEICFVDECSGAQRGEPVVANPARESAQLVIREPEQRIDRLL